MIYGEIKLKYLSLCIPTNGISEWVIPVLDKIFQEKADRSLWEVVVTDNGKDEAFQKQMLEYESKYENFVYKKTDAYLFDNQIEALRLASGQYLKFVNHRSIIKDGTVQWFIDEIKKNLEQKPVIYWSNGSLKYDKEREYDDIDGYAKALGEVASWTTGVGVWKEDFDTIPENHEFNKISPHSDVLYWVKENRKYKIIDNQWAVDIDTSHKQKGKYDLFKAFAIEEISIPLNLYLDGHISAKTLKHIIKRYEILVAGFYCNFVILRTPCSYDLSGLDESLGVFLSKRKVVARAIAMIPKYILVKVLR